MPSPIVVRTALQTLLKLRIPFRGPFITPQNNRIYLIDEHILSEQEIIAFYGDGKLKPENHSLLLDLKRLQRHEDRGDRQ